MQRFNCIAVPFCRMLCSSEEIRSFSGDEHPDPMEHRELCLGCISVTENVRPVWNA